MGGYPVAIQSIQLYPREERSNSAHPTITLSTLLRSGRPLCASSPKLFLDQSPGPRRPAAVYPGGVSERVTSRTAVHPGVYTGTYTAGYIPTMVYREAYSLVYPTHPGIGRHIAWYTLPTLGMGGI